MKPFNLAEALAGKPVVTRDGRKVQRIFHAPELDDGGPVLAVISGYLYTVYASGKYSSEFIESVNDLFMASEKKRGWVNIENSISGRPITAIQIFNSQDEALRHHCAATLATVPIEWEE